MSTSVISGTIRSVHYDGDRTHLTLVSGSNGSQREDKIVLPGQSGTLMPGKAVRLVDFVRSEDGRLMPAAGATLSIIKSPQPDPSAEHQNEHAGTEHPAPAQEAHDHTPVQGQPTPPAPQPSTTALASPAHDSAASLMVFTDKATRRRIFARAVDVAREFKEHISRTGQVITLDGRPYVTVAGWSILPAFEAAKCYAVNVKVQEDGAVIAEAVVERNGEHLSRGFGACAPVETIISRRKGPIERKRLILNDRVAMAQTRARGAALKARYAVLVTLAGYEASLADEVEDATAPTIVPTFHPKPPAPPRDATPPQPIQRPSQDQIDFALQIFNNEPDALLEKAAAHGATVGDVREIPVPIMKRIVEEEVNERKRRRATQAAKAA